MLASYLLLLLMAFLIYNKKVKYVFAFICSVLVLQLVYIFEKVETGKDSELIIFNQYKHTVIANKIGNSIWFYTSDSVITKEHQVIKNYVLSKPNSKTIAVDPLPNIIPLTDKKLLIIDSLGIYKSDQFKETIILLRQSPKINLERLILGYKPLQIIADGSNYKSYIRQWKKTCKEYEISFHTTYEQGAFKIAH